MADAFETSHQRTIQWGAEHAHQGRRSFAVLDDHIGLLFADVIDRLAADILRIQAVDCQRCTAAAMPLDQSRQLSAIMLVLALDIGLVQPLFAQKVLLAWLEQAQHMHAGAADLRQGKGSAQSGGMRIDLGQQHQQLSILPHGEPPRFRQWV